MGARYALKQINRVFSFHEAKMLANVCELLMLVGRVERQTYIVEVKATRTTCSIPVIASAPWVPFGNVDPTARRAGRSGGEENVLQDRSLTAQLGETQYRESKRKRIQKTRH